MQHRITDGTNGSSHQAVSWTICSPLIASPIHITGVYVSPSEGEVEEFFHLSPSEGEVEEFFHVDPTGSLP